MGAAKEKDMDQRLSILTFLIKTRAENDCYWCVGGKSDKVYWVSSVVRRTCKEIVREFLEKLIKSVPCRVENLVIVADNHSSHKSHYVKDYLSFAKI